MVPEFLFIADIEDGREGGTLEINLGLLDEGKVH
jgi:hypothetical protein